MTAGPVALYQSGKTVFDRCTRFKHEQWVRATFARPGLSRKIGPSPTIPVIPLPETIVQIRPRSLSHRVPDTHAEMPQSPAYQLLLLTAVLCAAAGHAIDESRDGPYREHVEPRALKTDSVLMGIAKSLIGGKTGGAASGQSLSLNMSNIVLMLVLRGLIWGVSYVQNGGKEARQIDGGTLPTAPGAFTEADALLFLGYLVADESGRYDCLNRVACEQPSRADSYLKSAEIVWNAARLFDDVVLLDPKYEEMLVRLQEAIEDGRADGDCQSKYKCFDSTTVDNFNLT